jgi:hypothetical protein
VKLGGEASISSAKSTEVWFDFKDLKARLLEIQEEEQKNLDVENELELTAKCLVRFIENYDLSEMEQGNNFSGVGDFHRFKRLVLVKKMEDLFNLERLKAVVFSKHPILVLHDIGGSLLYRTSDKVPGDRKVSF